MKRLLVGNYTGVWTSQLVAFSSLGKWQQTLLSVIFEVAEKHFKCKFFFSPLLNYSYTFSFA